MAMQLTTVEIKNFKSYADVVCVKNFKSLNNLIGANGVGKSNFMEAIAFAFGERKFRSRTSNIHSILHSTCNKDRDECYVSCTFNNTLEDITFKRTLRKKQDIYTINNDIVSSGEYKNELNKIGIIPKTRCSIIYRGKSIELLFGKPGERAAIFEEITGSIEYKKQYESLQKLIEQQLYQRNTLNEQYKVLRKKIRHCKLNDSREILRRESQSAYERLTRKLFLLQLYVAEEYINNYKGECELLQNKKIDKKKEVKQIQNDVRKKVQVIADNEKEIIDLKSKINAEEEQLKNVKKKIDNFSSQKIKKTEQMIHKTKQVEKSRIEQIKKLEDEYHEIEKLSNETKRQLQQLKKNNIMEMEKEYNIINHQYTTNDSLSEKIEEILKNIKNKKMFIIKKQDQVKQVSSFLENYDKYYDNYKNLNKEFLKLKEEKVEKHKLMKSHQKREKEIQQQLIEIEKQLQIAKSHRFGTEKNEAKKAIVKLIQEFNVKGVYGYLGDLCQPVHSRYKTAVDVILRRYSSTIIVDTEETTHLCHKIAQKFSERIEFLTLDLLKLLKINESLRNINDYKGIKNIKLAIDIVKFPTKIRPAVLYAFKNTLVCETPEDAYQIAYNTESKQRNACISLNGIYYNKSGIISKSKPKMKGNIPDTSSLKDTRKELLGELDEIRKQLTTMDSNQLEQLFMDQSECIEKKMSFLKNLMTTYDKQKEQRERLESELSSLMEEEKKDQQLLKKLETEKNEFETNAKFYENTLLKEFYNKHNITDIPLFQDRIKKLAKLQSDEEKYINHMQNIETLLKLEKKNDTNNLKSYQLKYNELIKQLQTQTNEYTTIQKKAEEKMKLLELLRGKLKEIDDANTKLKQKVHKLEKYLSELIQGFKLDYESYLRCSRLYKQYYEEFSNLLYEARGKNIPFINGSYNSVPSLDETDDHAVCHTDLRDFIEIDYSLISNEITNDNIDTIKQMCEELKSQLKILDEKISALYTYQEISQELEEIKRQLEEVGQQLNTLNKNLMSNKNNFQRVKQQRRDKFMNSFDVISEWVKKIYKKLSGNEDAQAFLEVLNLEEPYLGDIAYICLPKRKKFNGHYNLSGGEKVVAMLSLLFAVLKVDKSFLLLFDEVDAPLDKVHAKNIMEYFKTLNESHQIIYTSFNRTSMLYADKLIGVSKMNHNGSKTSRILTLNPDNY